MAMFGRILDSLKSGLKSVSEAMSAESLYYYDVFGANSIDQQKAAMAMSEKKQAKEDDKDIGSDPET